MPPIDALQAHFDKLRGEATQLAGRRTDVVQRAATYHHLYEHSGGNHVFPLIAAHGVLWSRGYFAHGLKLARALAWSRPFSARRRASLVASVERFADAFREINRRVCVETYVTYHFTAEYGNHPALGRFVTSLLATAMAEIHAARRAYRELCVDAKRRIFAAHFLDEQQRVVQPAITAALAAFDWPAMRRVSLRPTIRFAYFGPRRAMRFRRFDRQAERVERGLEAFDLAAAAGWRSVEASLAEYGVLPAEFFASSQRYFAATRARALNQAA